jgi:hypothetical protein
MMSDPKEHEDGELAEDQDQQITQRNLRIDDEAYDNCDDLEQTGDDDRADDLDAEDEPPQHD